MKNNIHPTAIVSSRARLDGVTVHPHVIIEKNVEVGHKTILQAGSYLYSGTVLGKQNLVGHHVVIGATPQDIHFRPETPSGVLIGDNNIIREMVTIHRATIEGANTTLHNNNYLMSLSHLGHDVQVQNNVIIANNTIIAGFCKIDSYAFLSGNVVVHQHCRIGSHVMVGGLAGVGQDLPPFILVQGYPAVYRGLNLVGLRRRKFSSTDIRLIKDCYTLLYDTKKCIALSHVLSLLHEKKQSLPHQTTASIDASPVEKILHFLQETSIRGILRKKITP